MFYIKKWMHDRFELVDHNPAHLEKESAITACEFTSLFGQLKAIFQLGRECPEAIVFSGRVYLPVERMPVFIKIPPKVAEMEAEIEEYETEEVDEEDAPEYCRFCGDLEDNCHEHVPGSYDDYMCKNMKMRV